MSNPHASDRRVRRGRFSPEVTRLLDRIRKLVAAQRALAERGGRREAYRREIARLQARLASVVKRELDPGAPL